MSHLAESTIFGSATSLPRGPHRLTREQVAASQRTRLMAAFTELLAECGYANVTIGELAARAGVSRAAFYEHFADKQACMLAAYDHFAATVVTAVTPEIEGDAPWKVFVQTTLDGYLGVLQGDLTAARAFLVEMDGAGRVARRRRQEAMQAFAGLLAARHAAIRVRNPSLGPLPRRVYLALALGVREVVHDALEGSPAPKLSQLGPDLTMLATAVVEGAAAAQALGR